MFSCGIFLLFSTSAEAFSPSPNSKQESCVVATAKGKHARIFFFLLLFLYLKWTENRFSLKLQRQRSQNPSLLSLFKSVFRFAENSQPPRFPPSVAPPPALLLLLLLPHSIVRNFLLEGKQTLGPKQTFFQSKLGSSLVPRASTERRHVLKRFLWRRRHKRRAH